MSSPNADSSVNRRPISSRNHYWAQRLALYLTKKGISANRISLASLIFAVIGFVALWLSADISLRWQPSLFVGAALCCQLRLLCNLLDGMVAMESSVRPPTGALWNEIPDRFSDILFFVGIGFAADDMTLALVLSVLAVLLSYVREFGHGVDGSMDYVGPMAKPQRMALTTFVLLLASLVGVLPVLKTMGMTSSDVLSLGLWLMVFGCVGTLVRRLKRLVERVSH
ncbi:MAG: CDP-alcohol phosphatidyltransferase family protein [Granulosicoccus sp.]